MKKQTWGSRRKHLWNEANCLPQQRSVFINFPTEVTPSPRGSPGSGLPVTARKEVDSGGESSGHEGRDIGWSRLIFVKWEWTIRNRRQFSFECLSHSQWAWWKTLLPCLLGDFNMARLWNLMLYWILYWMWCGAILNYKRRGWNSAFQILAQNPFALFLLQIWSYLLIFSVWKDPLSILSGCPIFHCVIGCILKMNSPNNFDILLLLYCSFEEILHLAFAL